MSDGPDKRQHPRHEIPLEGTLRSGGNAAPCTVRNLSAGGALLEVDLPLRPGHLVTVEIPEIGAHSARVVRVIWKFAAIALQDGDKEVEGFIVEWMESQGKDTSTPTPPGTP